MNCTHLDHDEGMLFLFPEPRQQGFWMRNTPLDLDLAYITGDGSIDEIKRLRAHDPEIIYSRSAGIRYVLEMPAGYFGKNKITAGTRLDLASLRPHLLSRGFRPNRYLPDGI